MVWSATLALDRRVASPTTASIATLQTDDKSLIETDVTTALPSGSTYSGYETAAYTIIQSNVAWASSPTKASTTNNTITINLTSDNNYGELACIAEANGTWNANTKPTGEQIYLGVNRNNGVPLGHKKVAASTTDGTTTTATTSLTIDGLAKGVAHDVFCTATNGVATFPSYIVYANDDLFTPVAATTSGEVEEDDSDDLALLASSNVVSVFLMIAALIFN